MRSTFIAGAVVIAAASAASAQEVTLRAVSAFAEKTTYSRGFELFIERVNEACLLYTSPSPRDRG